MGISGFPACWLLPQPFGLSAGFFELLALGFAIASGAGSSSPARTAERTVCKTSTKFEISPISMEARHSAALHRREKYVPLNRE